MSRTPWAAAGAVVGLLAAFDAQACRGPKPPSTLFFSTRDRAAADQQLLQVRVLSWAPSGRSGRACWNTPCHDAQVEVLEVLQGPAPASPLTLVPKDMSCSVLTRPEVGEVGVVRGRLETATDGTPVFRADVRFEGARTRP